MDVLTDPTAVASFQPIIGGLTLTCIQLLTSASITYHYEL